MLERQVLVIADILLQEISGGTGKDVIRPFKGNSRTIPNTDDVDAGPVLWNPMMLCIEELVGHRVLQPSQDLGHRFDHRTVLRAQ